jgi:predicted GNAT family acetyltransferase
MTLLKTGLDNPIWEALTSHQDYLAEGTAIARRFPADIGPLAGMESQSERAYKALTGLVVADEQLVLFLDETAAPTSEWHMDIQGHLTQMTFEKELFPESNMQIQILTEADIPEMLTLTKLTKPGPFEKRTIELGTYLGIRVEGNLVAMAGERLHLKEYTEVSAVCTHPDFQGKGYAGELIKAVANQIMRRGEIPFLHAWIDNVGAIRVYEKLGFEQRRIIHLAVLRKTK